MRIGALTLLVILLAASASAAAAVRPEDFAYGRRLTFDPGAAAHRLELPAEVYRELVRPDLADLCVFNGRGEVVPFALLPPEKLRPEARPPVPLPFFPLPAQKGRRPEELALEFTRDADRTEVRLHTGAGGAPPKPRPPLVIDASGLTAAPDHLELEWERPEGGLSARLRLRTSDDLQRWETLGRGLVLADLSYRGQRLRKNRVPVAGNVGRYLRLDWQSPPPRPEITAVRAVFAAPPAPRPRFWLPVADLKPGEKAGEYRFRPAVNGHIDRLRFHLPEDNTLIRATLYSRPDDGAKWRRRFRGSIYHLRADGVDFKNRVASFRPVADRQWKLRIAADGGGLGTGRPELETGWPAHRLIFIARGEAPFILAYGSGAASPAPLQMADLPGRVAALPEGAVREAVAGARETLGGAEKRARPARPLPWSRLLLWLVLVAGVGLLAWMCRRLVRQMAAAD